MCKYNCLMLTGFMCVCKCAVHKYLDEFILDGLCSLQLCLDHTDELVGSVFCPNVAETSFFNELQEETV